MRTVITTLTIVFAISMALMKTSFAKEKKDMTKPVVVVKTSEGTIKIELWAEKAPATVKNFLRYTEEKHYDGGFAADMKEKKTHEPVKNEASKEVKNDRGTVAMARTNVVDSATSQFFINLADNAFLNHRDKTPQGFGYCVFGKVTEGMDVVDKIAKVKTTTKGRYENVPAEAVVIKSVRLEEKEEKKEKTSRSGRD